MMIRDQKTGALLDVEADGRRLTFEVENSVDHYDDCDCNCGGTTLITFDKAELAELLRLIGGGIR